MSCWLNDGLADLLFCLELVTWLFPGGYNSNQLAERAHNLSTRRRFWLVANSIRSSTNLSVICLVENRLFWEPNSISFFSPNIILFEERRVFQYRLRYGYSLIIWITCWRWCVFKISIIIEAVEIMYLQNVIVRVTLWLRLHGRNNILP